MLSVQCVHTHAESMPDSLFFKDNLCYGYN